MKRFVFDFDYQQQWAQCGTLAIVAPCRQRTTDSCRQQQLTLSIITP